MKRLKDEVIVITGSCTGIGKAMAIRFVEEGARVVVHGLERDLGEQLVADLGDESATLHIQDLEDVDCAGNLVQRAVERWGRLDALVNNAAWVATGGIKDTNLERLLGNCFFNPNVRTPRIVPGRRGCRGRKG